MKKKKKILITGVAGFIGFSLARKIIQSKNFDVIGIDNLNSYYIKKLKLKRLSLLKHKNFKFYKIDLIIFYRVLLAEDLLSQNSLVALKLFKEKFISTTKNLQEVFLKEVEILASLKRHRNVVEILHVNLNAEYFPDKDQNLLENEITQ